ncbi:MAG TPA: aminopeptidase P family N-terminal domain-containing protein, partial [Arthrobacter sp.]|nr:aminopeptidase P family N-terminal domain-containing protein [Arthrobacter sp.]
MPKLTQTTCDYRHKKMAALMDTLQVDALIFTSADFFQFATNFPTDVQPWERPILAVVPRDGAPFLIMNELSTNHVRFSIEHGKLWITDISFYAEHPKVSNRLPLIGQLHELVAER